MDDFPRGETRQDKQHRAQASMMSFMGSFPPQARPNRRAIEARIMNQQGFTQEETDLALEDLYLEMDELGAFDANR
jgi:hypothetical protein